MSSQGKIILGVPLCLMNSLIRQDKHSSMFCKAGRRGRLSWYDIAQYILITMAKGTSSEFEDSWQTQFPKTMLSLKG